MDAVMTNLWNKYASQSRIQDWFGMSEQQVRETLTQAGASAEEIEAEIHQFMTDIRAAENN